MKKLLFNSRLAFLFVLSMLFSANVLAQAGASSITGTVTDGQGNAVPNATVTLVAGENNRRTTVTNDSGVYTFSAVQPGTYQIEVEGQGFKKSSVSNVQALVDKTTEIAVVLEIGAVSETVNVDASSIESIVNTTDASIGNNFVEEQIRQLPLNARNVANLLSLQSGVTQDGSTTGSRSDQSNITLDGVDVNNQQEGTAFTPVLRVNPDSIEEFRVTTSNPNSTQGRSSGAQVSLITRGGTNDFQGALYHYHRNTVTTANEYFNNLAGVARPKLLRNLFGGRIGGPIVKDRLFFFYNYEGFREAKDSSVVRLVPLASLGQGTITFRDTSGATRTLTASQINGLTSSGVPVVDVNPAALSILAGGAGRYAANDFSIGDGLNTAGYRFNASVPVKQNTHTARFDWNITRDQSHILSLRGNYQHDLEVPVARIQAFPDTPAGSRWNHPYGFAVSHTWLINSNMTNRASYGLTRLAFSDQGDSSENSITFRNVFSPSNFLRDISRVNPTHNIADDFTWLKGNHTLQFGTNIRIIRNKRTNFGTAFDTGIANFGVYQGSGGVLLTPVNDYLAANFGTQVAPGSTASVQDSLTAVLGRISQYTANFNFGLDGQPLAAGSPTVREWATEEYDFYVQDTWKFRPNVTITAGLRYGLSRPVYETQGFQVAPNIPLQEYFESRLAAAERGENYTEPLILDTVGPKNGKPGFYAMDKNNFQPRVAVAWSPNFKSGFLGKFFGKEQESVIRAGFAITNDYFGQQLAVTFDAANTLGFSTSRNTVPNTFNITTNPAPLITGVGQPIRTLPGIVPPSTLTFPQQQAANNARRIESSLDTNLVSPINYSWNLSYGRQLPLKMYVDVSYVGRAARNLLATRDVMAPNNIKDPRSGQTYYEAARAVELQLRAGVPRSQIAAQPFFENTYAAGSLDFVGTGGTNTQNVVDFFNFDLYGNSSAGANDWTYIQDILDGNSGRELFYQSQYAALSSFGTISSSDYHAALVTIRQRAKGLTWDLNYTFSKSLDDASGLQTGGNFGTGFILNPILQQDSRAFSDFDIRHIVNFNSVWEIPIGRNRQIGGGMNKFLDAIIGGWQLTNIFRYNSGLPATDFFDNSGWVTNWQIKSGGVRNQPLESSESKTGNAGRPNLFSNVIAAYRSFRSPLPGESGDRNQLRLPSFFTLDAGLYKTFGTPWSENHKIQFRWEVFNVTNTARMGGVSAGAIIADTRLGYQPNKGTPPAAFGNFVGQQGEPRVMQFALRYDF